MPCEPLLVGVMDRAAGRDGDWIKSSAASFASMGKERGFILQTRGYESTKPSA